MINRLNISIINFDLFKAAHCVNSKYTETILSINKFHVSLGRFNISSPDDEEPDSITTFVKEIKIHPHWNPYEPKYDADIAILVLHQSIVSNDYMKPACLPLVENEDVSGDGIVVCSSFFGEISQSSLLILKGWLGGIGEDKLHHR